MKSIDKQIVESKRIIVNLRKCFNTELDVEKKERIRCKIGSELIHLDYLKKDKRAIEEA